MSVYVSLFIPNNTHREIFSDPNQSENGKYNLISVWLNKISKRVLCVFPRY